MFIELQVEKYNKTKFALNSSQNFKAMNDITTHESFSIFSLSFMSHAGPKWNIYLYFYCAKFEYKF